MKTTRWMLLAAGLMSAGATYAGPLKWVTLGDAAYAELRKIAPQATAKASRAGQNEALHMVALDEDVLPRLSAAVHRDLKRCGGFFVHNTEGEAMQAIAGAPVAVAALTRPSYTIDNQTTVNSLLPQLQESNITQTIVDMSSFANRYYKTVNGSDASNWLKQKWTTMASGRSDITVSQFAHTGYNQKSVILTINGTDNGSEVIVLGAHLDSINLGGNGETSRSPGADDDASGIASLTEALRVMINTGYKPRRTIKFIGYAAEEAGLLGSQDIAASFKNSAVNVVGVMQLDMTNYKGSVNDIYIYTDYTDSLQNDFVAKLAATYLPTLKVGYDKCGYGCSDHASWNAKGYPASLPFEAAFNGDNPYIHTANDTYANSGNQAAHALKFARLAAAYAVELGSDGPGTPGGTDKVESFTGSLAAGQQKSYGPFKASIGTFKAETSGTGDADLYVRKSAVPTTSTYTCKSDGSTATETCSFSMTANGDVYVLVRGYTSTSYTLKVTYKPQ